MARSASAEPWSLSTVASRWREKTAERIVRQGLSSTALRAVQEACVGSQNFNRINNQGKVHTGMRIGDRVHIGRERHAGEPVYEILDYVMPGRTRFPCILMGIVNKAGKVGRSPVTHTLNCVMERV